MKWYKVALVLAVLLIVLVPLVGCGESATKAASTRPASQSAKTTSTADLLKQIDRLNRSISTLEKRVGSLEDQVGGRSLLLGGGLSGLEKRVSALEDRVGGGFGSYSFRPNQCCR